MPQRTLYRQWCKTCNEFELHIEKEFLKKDLACMECKTEYTDIKLKDIPLEKRKEQRKRYNNSKDTGLSILFGSYLGSAGYPFSGMFDEPGSNDEIRESDAGQRAIDEYDKKQRDIAYEKRRIRRKEEVELKKSFHKLGRNDKCLCGSDKKYKKCCWTKIQKI